MAFRIGDNVHVHADAQIQLIPSLGPNKGIPFLVRACKSMSGDHNGKAITMMGNSILPVAVALASAEPSFTFGLDIMQVSVDYMEHVGDGAARMDHRIVVTMNRPGLAPITFTHEQCIIEKGFGYKGDAGAQFTDELSGKCRSLKVKYKGKTFNPFTLPGAVELV